MRIGCSGWHYASWRGDFYPADLPPERWLEAYAQSFDSVELNNSFYRLPEATQFDNWGSRVPRAFLFAVKASRYLTHLLRLTRPQEPLERLLDRAAHLGPHLGPILYQLPPRWMPDEMRMRTFLEALPSVLSTDGHSRPLQHVIEFRDERCYTDAMMRALEEHGVSMCVHDMEGSTSPRVVVGPTIYVRLHGFGQRYGGSYPPAVLQEWAEWLLRVAAGRPAYVFFNNDINGHAVYNARTLRELLGPAAER